MIKLELLLGAVAFAIWVFTLIDVLSTPEPLVRGLPKIGWVIVVVIFGVIGALAWFVMGRPEKSGPATADRARALDADIPRVRPTRARAAAADPEKDEAFLRQVRERAEEQRKRYEQEKRNQQPPEPPAEA